MIIAKTKQKRTDSNSDFESGKPLENIKSLIRGASLHIAAFCDVIISQNMKHTIV